jgi:hypothetical protein
VEHHVVGQQLLQPLEIALLGGREEAGRELQAFDPNFSRLSVAAQGNSSLSVSIVGVPAPLFPGGAAVPLSKTYNGVLADQGYPVPTEFVWDPWSDPAIVENPCCYVVRIDISDRAVLNNGWGGGHGNSGWEAIEISL